MAAIQVTLHPSLLPIQRQGQGQDQGRETQPLLHVPRYEPPKTSRKKKILQGLLVFLTISVSVIAIVKSSLGFTSKHTTYERIGNNECPNIWGTMQLYTGITISYKTSTSYTGFKCMPYTDIKYYPGNESTYNSTEQINYGKMVEYKTFTNSNNYTAACAVCMVEWRSSIMVLPATYECLGGWTKEYEGYLMTGNTCVDKEMKGEYIPSDPEEEPSLRHEVVTNLGYQNQKVLSCVVCSI